GARTAPVRFVLKALMADDIDHARIGWAHLASPRLSPERRREVAAWLPSLIRATSRTWGDHPPLPESPALDANGCPSLAETAVAVETALREMIVPGLRRFGFVIA